jgi:hypothetical protein
MPGPRRRKKQPKPINLLWTPVNVTSLQARLFKLDAEFNADVEFLEKKLHSRGQVKAAVHAALGSVEINNLCDALPIFRPTTRHNSV